MMGEINAIATQGLTKQFERHIAIKNIDLEVAEGEVYGLIGPNGAGKTTLIRLLAMAEEATVGEIYLYGDRLSKEDSNLRLKQYIGYLPDDFPLYEELTVWDYLDYFARLYFLQTPHRRRRLEEVLELVQLTSKRHSIIATLSRGMKQRLSLARTIIHEPILLLLDEPVSGLDPIARMQFREIIKVLQSAGMTILISSHVLSDLAELCTSIGIMELGSLVESTSLKTLYERLSHQTIHISVLDNSPALIQELKQYSWVENYEMIPDSHQVKVHFTGNLEDSANLLRSLILAGLPITQFHTSREDLETIFLKLGHQQAS
jgi:ABC-2 type transport system ATP-binding protein